MIKDRMYGYQKNETQGANCSQMTQLPLSFQGYISFENSITLSSLMTKHTQNQRIFLFTIWKNLAQKDPLSLSFTYK